VRHLVLVLSDQLNRDASVWDGFNPAQDIVWMAEASEESTHVRSSKQRTVLFLSAMRHFARHCASTPLRCTTASWPKARWPMRCAPRCSN